MALTISQDEFVAQASEVLEAAGKQTVFLEKNGERVAAIVSIAEYESTREAKAERIIEAMNAIGNHMASVMSPEELDAFEKELLQRAR